jgi:hypothetical protein
MIRRFRELAPLSSFRFAGEVRELKEPEGPPTARQLLKLNGLGVLCLVEPGQVEPLTKGLAAAVLDALLEEPDEKPRHRAVSFP